MKILSETNKYFGTEDDFKSFCVEVLNEVSKSNGLKEHGKVGFRWRPGDIYVVDEDYTITYNGYKLIIFIAFFSKRLDDLSYTISCMPFAGLSIPGVDRSKVSLDSAKVIGQMNSDLKYVLEKGYKYAEKSKEV
jgi:hypothetical protein